MHRERFSKTGHVWWAHCAPGTHKAGLQNRSPREQKRGHPRVETLSPSAFGWAKRRRGGGDRHPSPWAREPVPRNPARLSGQCAHTGMWAVRGECHGHSRGTGDPR